MRVSSSSMSDLIVVGPPFLHWVSGHSPESLHGTIQEQLDGKILIRRIDGAAASNLQSLGKELGRGTGGPIAANHSALDDVMRDVHWVTGTRGPVATVYIISNASRILHEIPAGMATWGTKAENRARAWAKAVNDGENWATIQSPYISFTAPISFLEMRPI